MALLASLCLAACLPGPPPAKGLSCQQDSDCWDGTPCIRKICGGSSAPTEATTTEEKAAEVGTSETKEAPPPEPREGTPDPQDETPIAEEAPTQDGGVEQPSETQDGGATEPPEGDEMGDASGENPPEPPPEQNPEPSCRPGTSRTCYTGPANTQGVGPCKAGVQYCNVQGNGWNECTNQVIPQPENCTNQVDDDCDGNADPPELCKCDAAQPRACFNAPRGCIRKSDGTYTCQGNCEAGSQKCINNNWALCLGSTAPQKEICDNQDNDCDGVVDNDLVERCYDGPSGTQNKGSCSGGIKTCQKGQWSACTGQVKPTTETCDGLDNDCDGTVDEADAGCQCQDGNQQACGSNRGTCQAGAQTCQNQQWGPCVGASAPQTETCNGKDDDCDGSTDEDFPALGQSCQSGLGACQSSGKIVCNTDGKTTRCDATAGTPQPETCNGKDDDCDGAIDEELTRPCYSGTTGCTLNAGTYTCAPPCNTGTETCQKGQWSACTGEVKPTTETCSGKDDDCDGKVDNIADLPLCPKQDGVCKGARKTCQNGAIVDCDKAGYLAHNAAYEDDEQTCDGKDNDCDGQTDETYKEQSSGCAAGGKGECASGTASCNKGTLVCTPKAPEIEICSNNKDEDCDGTADNQSNCRVDVQKTIADFAAFKNGTLLAIHTPNNGINSALEASCWDKDGASKKAIFRLDFGQNTDYLRPMALHTAGADVIFTIWISKNRSSSAHSLHIQVFDDKCNSKLSTLLTLPILNPQLYDATATSQGVLALVLKNAKQEILLYNFTSVNSLSTPPTPLLLNPTANNPDPCLDTLHVALSTSNSGVVTCRGQNAIFSRGYYLDGGVTPKTSTNKFTPIPETQGRVSNTPHNHVIGMNSDSIFAMQWVNDIDELSAVFYNAATGQLVQSLPFIHPGIVLPNTTLFTATHQHVATLGKNFILRNTPPSPKAPTTWSLYNPQGKLIATDTSNTMQHDSLRVYDGDIFLHDGQTILKDAIDLSSGHGLCNGFPCVCTPSATRSCYAGGPPGAIKSPCKAGSQTCASDGLSWSACTGEILPQPESCNNQKDDDCDGTIDENCSTTGIIQPAGVTDLDVASETGKIITIYDSGYGLLVQCFQADGTPIQSTTALVRNTQSLLRAPTVKISPNGSFSLVSWLQKRYAQNKRYTRTSLLLDDKCQPLSTTPLPWPGPEADANQLYDTDVDNDGHFVHLRRSSDKKTPALRFYDKQNTLLGYARVDPNDSKCPNTRGMHVAFRNTPKASSQTTPLQRSGIVTCQGDAAAPIYYRRFDATYKLLSTDMSLVKHTEQGQSADGQSHSLGINADGAYVIAWHDSKNKKLVANFYKPDASLTLSVDVQSNLPSTIANFFAFANPHQKILRFSKDFILHNAFPNNTAVQWFRYDALGARKTQALWQNTYLPRSLRAGKQSTFILDTITLTNPASKHIVIRINALSF